MVTGHLAYSHSGPWQASRLCWDVCPCVKKAVRAPTEVYKQSPAYISGEISGFLLLHEWSWTIPAKRKTNDWNYYQRSVYNKEFFFYFNKLNLHACPCPCQSVVGPFSWYWMTQIVGAIVCRSSLLIWKCIYIIYDNTALALVHAPVLWMHIGNC